MEGIKFGRRSVLKLTAGTAASAIAAKFTGQPLAAGGPSEIVMMDAISLQNAIQSRRISCVEVMAAYLNHIEKVNPKVNAIVALQDRAQLISQAKERDGQLSRGEVMGPLHGFPHAVKDLQPVKGMRTTMGSPIFKDFIAPADSLMVERVRKAGAIFIGKTNTPEFGLGSHTFMLSMAPLAMLMISLARLVGAAAGLASALRFECSLSRMEPIMAAASAIQRAGTMSLAFAPAMAASQSPGATFGFRQCLPRGRWRGMSLTLPFCCLYRLDTTSAYLSLWKEKVRRSNKA